MSTPQGSAEPEPEPGQTRDKPSSGTWGLQAQEVHKAPPGAYGQTATHLTFSIL